MPKSSDKIGPQCDLEAAIKLSVLLEASGCRVEGTIANETLQGLLLMHQALTGARYLIPRTYVRNKASMAGMLHSYTDRQFRQEARMDRASFDRMVKLLENHPIFHNNSRFDQTPTWIQCLVAFKRLGSYGNANSLGNKHHISCVSLFL